MCATSLLVALSLFFSVPGPTAAAVDTSSHGGAAHHGVESAAWLDMQQVANITISEGATFTVQDVRKAMDGNYKSALTIKRGDRVQWFALDMGCNITLTKLRLFKDSVGGIEHASWQRASAHGEWIEVRIDDLAHWAYVTIPISRFLQVLSLDIQQEPRTQQCEEVRLVIHLFHLEP
jgi:hypothetical protein